MLPEKYTNIKDDCLHQSIQDQNHLSNSKIRHSCCTLMATMTPSTHRLRKAEKPAGREIFVRRSEDRGHTDFYWMNRYHTFSFGDFIDPSFSGFRSLRVLNEDYLRAGEGFPPQLHRDVEILSYVIEGGLAHKDNIEGDGVVNLIRPGEFQLLSAGTGMLHAEFNASEHASVHFVQLWIEPKEKDLDPSYEQSYFSRGERRGLLKLVASPDGSENSLTVHQDVRIYSGILEPQSAILHRLPATRYGWMQILAGKLDLNGKELKAGDGAAIIGGGPLELTSLSDAESEILLFDLA
jgi:redox-sensitive bicupin YhaK (pirin superfamily)